MEREHLHAGRPSEEKKELKESSGNQIRIQSKAYMKDQIRNSE